MMSPLAPTPSSPPNRRTLCLRRDDRAEIKWLEGGDVIHVELGGIYAGVLWGSEGDVRVVEGEMRDYDWMVGWDFGGLVMG